MKRLRLILFTLLVLTLISCSAKQILQSDNLTNNLKTGSNTNFIDNETLNKILISNKCYKLYSGKATIELFDGNEIHKISALIKITADGYIVIKFLGLFNLVVGTLIYDNDTVEYISNRSGDINIKDIINSYDLPKVLSYFSSNNTTPNNLNYEYIDTTQGKVLSSENSTIVVDIDSHKVISYNDSSNLVIYEKDADGKIKKLTINSLTTPMFIAIEFQNIKNWMLED